MARDDSDFRSLYEFEGMDVPQGSEGVESVMCEDGPVSRWDKSLGVLCQKFVMLFLITPVGPSTTERYVYSVYMHIIIYIPLSRLQASV